MIALSIGCMLALGSSRVLQSISSTKCTGRAMRNGLWKSGRDIRSRASLCDYGWAHGSMLLARGRALGGCASATASSERRPYRCAGRRTGGPGRAAAPTPRGQSAGGGRPSLRASRNCAALRCAPASAASTPQPSGAPTPACTLVSFGSSPGPIPLPGRPRPCFSV